MRDKNKFHILNHIIYNLYNFDHFEETKLQMLEDLAFVVPNCCASLFMADPDNENLLCDPICHPAHYVQMENRYLKVKDKDFSDWITHKKNPFIVKVSDLMEDEEREQTDYYKLCFAPFGVHHVVYMTIASRNHTLGLLVLYRKKEEEDFDEDDIFWLQMLNEHLNQRFYKEAGIEEKSGDDAPDTYQLIKHYHLTVRETEIITQIRQNKPNAAICSELGISSNTLKKHLQNIYRKTNVNGKKELLRTLKDYK